MATLGFLRIGGFIRFIQFIDCPIAVALVIRVVFLIRIVIFPVIFVQRSCIWFIAIIK